MSISKCLLHWLSKFGPHTVTILIEMTVLGPHLRPSESATLRSAASEGHGGRKGDGEGRTDASSKYDGEDRP